MKVFVLTVVMTEEAQTSKQYEQAIGDFVSHCDGMILEMTEGTADVIDASTEIEQMYDADGDPTDSLSSYQ